MTGLICGLILLASKDKIRTLLFMLCFFYIFPAGWIFYAYTGILLVDVPLIFLVGVGLAGDRPFRFYIKGISPALLIIIAWMSMSCFQAIDFGLAVAEVSKWLRAYLIFIVVANAIRTEQDFKAALYGILLGFAFECFVGFYQWRVGTLGLWFLGERLYRPEWWRTYGTFYVPSYFANYLLVIIPLTMRFAVYMRHRHFMHLLAYITLFLLGVLVLYTTLTRSAWIGFVVSFFFMFVISTYKSRLRPRLKWPLLLLLIFASGFTIKYLPNVKRQFGKEREGAYKSRFYQSDVALRLIKDNLLFGAGPGNYELLSSQYVVIVDNLSADALDERIHNTYLLLMAENGVIVGMAFLAFLFQYFKIAAMLYKSQYALYLNVSFGLALGIMALMVSFLAVPDIHNEQTLNQMMVAAGLAIACLKMDRLQNHKRAHAVKMANKQELARGMPRP
jgi:hypothetical protein